MPRCRVRDLPWFLLAFVAGQLVLGTAVEHALPDVRDPEYAVKEDRLRQRRREKPDHALVVMLGSSRASLGLRAALLSELLDSRGVLVFNAALSGGGPVLELVCLRRLLAAGLRPDLLLVEVVPFHFNQPAGLALEERVLNGVRLRQSELAGLRGYWQEPERQERQWWKGRLLPALLQPTELREAFGLDTVGADSDDPHQRIDSHGWHPRYPGPSPERQRVAAAQALRQYAPFTGTFRLASRPVQALADLLAACRSEGIPVQLLLMPEGSAVRGLYSPEVRDGIDRFLAEFCETWQVPLVDARGWAADEWFWDGHHLLPAGAWIWTLRLGGDVLLPLVPELHRHEYQERVTLRR